MINKHLASNICKQKWRWAIIGDIRGLSQKLPNMQSLKVRIELGTIFKQLYYNFRHRNNIFKGEQPKNMLNLTSGPIEG